MAASLCLLVACTSPYNPETQSQPETDIEDIDGGPGCASAAPFFDEQLWDPILRPRCLFCHYAGGPADNSQFVLVEGSSPAEREANFAVTCAMALTDNDGSSQLLLKPSYQTDHGGGLRVAEGSEEYVTLETFVGLAMELSGCHCDADDTGV